MNLKSTNDFLPSAVLTSTYAYMGGWY